MTIECPRCKRTTVDILAAMAKCNTCGWEGPRCFGEMWDKTDPKCCGGADPTNWKGGTHVRPKCSYDAACCEAQEKCRKEQVIQPQALANKPWQNVEVRTPTMPTMQMPQPTVLRPPQPMMNAAPKPFMNQAPGVGLQVRQQQIQVNQVPTQPRVAQQPAQQPTQVVTQYRQVQHIGQVPQPMQQLPQQIQQMQQPQVPVHMPVAGAPMAWVPPQNAAIPMYVPQNYPAPGVQVPAYLTAPEPMNNGIAPMFFNSCMRAALKGAFHTAANIMDHVPWGR